MKNFNDLATCGDIIPLKRKLDTRILAQELKGFKFRQYNTKKNHIDRKGLSISNSKEIPNSYELESLREINEVTGLSLRDHDFRDKTEVYYKSSQIQQIIEGFHQYLGRAHIIEHGPGGYFPPHRDIYSAENDCQSMRIFVPLDKCNAPDSYFMLDEKMYTWEHGRAYFINTNKMHHFFTYNAPARFIIFNVDVNEETLKLLLEEFWQ
jgi:aspartyl/asparaginyl beta-hydroxylase (cupin superfamily)